MNAVREIIYPASEQAWLDLRKKDITSTEIASLFGLSRWSTAFETWHHKHDKTTPAFEEKECIAWGKCLQDAIAKKIAADNGWDIRPMNEYIRAPERRLGASFDYAIGTHGVLEIKNVFSLQFQDGWIVDGKDIEAPPDIEIQLQQQLALSERRVGYIGALVGGNRLVLLEREPNTKVIDAIYERTAAFWDSVDQHREPTPNFVEDSEFICQLYGAAHKQKVWDGRGNLELAGLAMDYRTLATQIKMAEEQRKAIKAEILMKIGDAGKVLGDEFSISAGEIKETTVETYVRKGHRDFRVSWKKTK